MTVPALGPSHEALARAPHDVALRAWSVALLLSAVLPVAPSLSRGLFLWDLWSTLPLADAVPLIVAPVAGLMLFGVSLWPGLTRLGLGVAALVLAVGGALTVSTAPLAREGLLSGALGYLGRAPWPLMAGFVAMGVGGRLGPISGLRPLATVLLGAGALLSLSELAVTQRGRPLLVDIVESLGGAFGALSGKAALLAFDRGIFGALPLLVAGIALHALLRGDSGREAGRAAVVILPSAGVLSLVPFAISGGDGVGTTMLMQLRGTLWLSACVGLFVDGLDALLRHLLEPSLPSVPPRSLLLRDVLLRDALRAAVASPEVRVLDHARRNAGVTTRWLVRRRVTELQDELPGPDDHATRLRWLERADPEPGLADPRPSLAVRTACGVALAVAGIALPLILTLSRPGPELEFVMREPPPDEAVRFFERAVPQLGVLLARRTEAVAERKPSGAATQRLRAHGQDLAERARTLDPDLGEAFKTLVNGLDAVDLYGELWSDRVGRVNRALRRTGLPFYVEPEYYEIRDREAQRTGGPWRPVTLLLSYRVERVRHFRAGQRRYGVLDVRRIDHVNVATSRLGYVRPDEPFAVVDVGAIERESREDLGSLHAPDTCGLAMLTGGPQARQADAACGRLRQTLFTEGGPTQETLVRLHVAGTTRHELQHQVDGEDLAVPRLLYDRFPDRDERLLHRIAKEASAYLCELQTEDSQEAWLHARQVIALAVMRSSFIYATATALAVGAVMDEAGILESGLPKLDLAVALAQAMEAEGANVGAWLTLRAGAAHEALFGTPCAVITPD